MLLLAVAVSACKDTKTVEQIPLEDFFRNPEKTEFAISPGGNYISYLQPYDNTLNIYVRELGTGTVTQVTAGKHDNIR